MGQLVDGVWEDTWYNTKKTGGKFVRSETTFRNWITPDGEFPAEPGRYHLYVSYACPWAHRTLIFREIKGLSDLITTSVVHPDMLSDGWTFATDFPGATGDTLYGLPFARDIYTKSDPKISGRVTVPILWDKKAETIVSNESSEIIRMFNSAFNEVTGKNDDYWPEEMRDAWPLVQLAGIGPEVRVVDHALAVALEMQVIDRVETEERRDEAPVGFGDAVTHQVTV